MTSLNASVFEFVDEYVAELETTSRSDIHADEGLVLFVREFFNQFFAELFGIQISDFSDPDATASIWVDIKGRVASEPLLDPITSSFREFCQDYKTIIGEQYDREGQATTDFETHFVPGLLRDIAQWATDVHREEIAQAAEQALQGLEAANKRVDDTPRNRLGRLFRLWKPQVKR